MRLKKDKLFEVNKEVFRTKINKDKYEQLGCEFLNESDCEEMAEEVGWDFNDLEKEHFDEDEELKERVRERRDELKREVKNESDN